MSRRTPIAALAVAATLIAVGGASAGPPAAATGSGVHLKRIATFHSPDYVAQPPGTKHLLYVVGKNGAIQVFHNGERVAQPFLDIRDLVETTDDDGLASMAFDPNYRKNRRFYVIYVINGGDVALDMFKRSRNSPERAVPSSQRTVMRIHHPDSGTHNGDQLQFGRDGHLYISVGDGGCCYDPYDNARKLNTLLGKILRIDPRPQGGYSIPAGNPLVGKPGRDEIFAWGLRNPWRFSFDRKTGRMIIGDVGQDSVEEIDYETIPAATGANFGWPQYEGDTEIDPGRPGPGPPVFPIQTYPHGPGCAVIGGYVIRDPSLPSLYGRYIYGDACSLDLRTLQPHLGSATHDHSLNLPVMRNSSFGEGNSGRIYVASLRGPVYRLVPNR